MHKPNILRGVPNPFQTVAPPAWWLKELALFDPQLVLFPSQKRGTFVLGRRATHSAGEPLHDVKGLTQNPDTIVLRAHHLVRVCEIMPGVIWDQRIFIKLAAHDIRRQGGPAEVANKLDAMDVKKEQQIATAQEDELHNRSTDAYRSYKTRVGERLSLAATPHGRGTLVKHPVSVHVRTPSPSAPRSS